jgi:hypothetical protein
MQPASLASEQKRGRGDDKVDLAIHPGLPSAVLHKRFLPCPP